MIFLMIKQEGNFVDNMRYDATGDNNNRSNNENNNNDDNKKMINGV